MLHSYEGLDRPGGFSRVRLLSPLRHRDFRLLWSGLCVSLLGDGVFLVALAWQVYALWDAPTAMAMVGIAMTVPTLVFLLVGGALSDRMDRRLVMVASDVLRAVTITVLAVLSLADALVLWHLLVLVAIYGSAAAFFGPAFDAITPDVLPPDELAQANSLDQLIRPLALRLAGPAAGGLIVAGAGLPAAFALDALTFAVSAGTVVAMRPAVRAHAAAPESITADIRVGLRYVRSHTWLWGTFAAAAIAYLLFMGPTEVLVTYIVKQELGGSAADLGLVFAAGGVGSVLCALVMGQSGLPRRDITFMYLAWTAATLAVAGYGIATSVWQLMAACLIFNALETAGTIVWATAKQRHVPGPLLGRVSSLDWLISIGLLPLSFALTGPVSEAVGARETLVGAAVLGGIVTFAALFLPGMRAVEGRAPATTGTWTTFYDRVADVVHVRAPHGNVHRAVVRAWGAIDVDRAGEPVAVRYVAASERMPAGFLARLPGPPQGA
jgi:MFS family permease